MAAIASSNATCLRKKFVRAPVVRDRKAAVSTFVLFANSVKIVSHLNEPKSGGNSSTFFF